MRCILPYFLVYFHCGSSQLAQTPISTSIALKTDDYLKFSINETAAVIGIYYMTGDGTTAFFINLDTPRTFPGGGYYRNITINSTKDNSTAGGLSWMKDVSCAVLPTPSKTSNFTVLYQDEQWKVCGQGIQGYCSYAAEPQGHFSPTSVRHLSLTSLNVVQIRLCNSPQCICY